MLPPKVIDAVIGMASFGLSLAFPVIPAPAWVAILTAVRNGDVILADIEAICAAKGITIQYGPSDFPDPPIGATNEPSFTVGEKNEP